MFANEGSNRRYPLHRRPRGPPRPLAPRQRPEEAREDHARSTRFHIEQFAYLLDKLKAIQEGDGTLLDNSMIVYGSGIGDGNRHNHDDLPILLAGKGGGTIKTGRHVSYAEEHAAEQPLPLDARPHGRPGRLARRQHRASLGPGGVIGSGPIAQNEVRVPVGNRIAS